MQRALLMEVQAYAKRERLPARRQRGRAVRGRGRGHHAAGRRGAQVEGAGAPHRPRRPGPDRGRPPRGRDGDHARRDCCPFWTGARRRSRPVACTASLRSRPRRPGRSPSAPARNTGASSPRRARPPWCCRARWSRNARSRALVSARPYASYARIASLLYPPDAVRPGVAPGAPYRRERDRARQRLDRPELRDRRRRAPRRALLARPELRDRGRRRCSATTAGCRPASRSAAARSIGARCVFKPGAVIGTDGFGFAPDADGYVKVPHLGGVRLGNDVEVGANTTIDRGTIEDTVIGDGVKLDNQVQVGHNCRIGAHTVDCRLRRHFGQHDHRQPLHDRRRGRHRRPPRDRRRRDRHGLFARHARAAGTGHVLVRDAGDSGSRMAPRGRAAAPARRAPAQGQPAAAATRGSDR